MPKLQKLDNKGEPIGQPEYYSENVARKLLGFKTSKFRLVEKDLPKVSRENPVKIVTDFPLATSEQLEWIKEQTDINKLKGVIHLVKSKIVSDSLNKAIEVFNNK